ncbi:metallopeptidase family protein [Oceanicella actignis]|uniref:Predicted Zn-dependent protease, minimal metalloprotease (MMP)-like domain n=1 Tax=Oceanicella actignis TaxID=1189325 RepID=A0A1M7TS55_9RHOB|nr:putative Zn-dependent protease with MMP-like domain [Oceanicella actignis]SET77111.1 Predicted Zn-dependent protease, minimal metalloprotease (MMP)-like domain [Oceanicella actignis]SHN73561.1 Predicted Zn-dependent protease, minimal metalloprotease (MMP)-like domain [Oceanicella actignis]
MALTRPRLAGARAPDAEDLARMAREAFARLPEGVRAACEGLVIRVEELPDDDMLAETGLDDPWELTGLYRGVPLTERSVDDPVRLPDEVILFRRPILDEWIARGDVALGRLVTHVLVHEIAHHLGWSDEDIAQVDRWWE